MTLAAPTVMLKKRIATVAVAFPVLVAAVWFDRPLPWFSLAMVAWALLATHEFYRLTGVTRSLSLTVMGMVWSVLFILSPHFDRPYISPELLTSLVILSLLILIFRPQKEGALTTWALTMAGVLYVGWLLSLLVSMRLEAGKEWVFLALFTTFATDIAAFFVGKAIGRHHLAPRLSPGKTWEGAAGGVLGAVLVGVVTVAAFRMPLSWPHAVFLTIVVSIFAQLGGLAMSLLKRNVGVKDSGKIMPGHGGILDRTDSVLFAGVIVYYTVLALGG